MQSPFCQFVLIVIIDVIPCTWYVIKAVISPVQTIYVPVLFLADQPATTAGDAISITGDNSRILRQLTVFIVRLLTQNQLLLKHQLGLDGDGRYTTIAILRNNIDNRKHSCEGTGHHRN